MSRTRIVVHTDGACSGNPGPGGWGARLELRKGVREICGGEKDTTNNRMELTAAIMALKRLRPGRRVLIHSDSRYVVDGMTSWLTGWRTRGWRGSVGQPIANRDLWERLASLAAKHDARWEWARGHVGGIGNERADQLAREGVGLAMAGRESVLTRLVRQI